MKKIAVVGAGVMGIDIALNLACFGHKVFLIDLSEEILEDAKGKIRQNLRMVKMMIPSFKNLNFDDVLQRISFGTDYKVVADSDIVIENVSEDIDVKKEVYLKIQEYCRGNQLIFANTSCISITKIASFMKQPELVVGMHFMNPVPLKEVVEVVKGFHTSDDTITKSKEFLSTINKIHIVVNDLPGFVSNRLSHLFMNEAAFLVQDQVATPKEIDMIFKKGYGHAMGPLETADLIGLDTVMNSLQVLYENYQDSKFRCCPLLRKMVDAGMLGKKSGKGFYTY